MNGTWDSNYQSVIHFNAAGTQNDATGNSLNNTVGAASIERSCWSHD